MAVVVILHNRRFLALWSGNALSLVGTAGVRIAYPLLALALFDSPELAGWIAFAATIPTLILQVPAGLIADTVNRRLLMLVAQAVGLVATLAVLLASALDLRGLAVILIAAAVVEGSAFVVFGIAEVGAVRDVVDERERTVAFSFLEAEQPIANLAGRAVGGALFDLSRWAPFLFNAFSYVFCLWTLAFMPRKLFDPRPPTPVSPAADTSSAVPASASSPTAAPASVSSTSSQPAAFAPAVPASPTTPARAASAAASAPAAVPASAAPPPAAPASSSFAAPPPTAPTTPSFAAPPPTAPTSPSVAAPPPTAPTTPSVDGVMPETSRFWRRMGEGLVWMWRIPYLRLTTIVTGFTNILFQCVILMILVVGTREDRPAWTVGAILAAAGVGGILGSFAAPRLERRFSPRALFLGCVWAWTVMLAMIAVSTHPVVLVIAWAGVGAVGTVVAVTLTVTRARAVPDSALGRIVSAASVITDGAVPIGAVLGGYLLASAGPQTTAWILSIAMLAAAVVCTRLLRPAPIDQASRLSPAVPE
ncbi:MFS transporter [Paractinoplanes lichenicola]|uniref:MFS transporter n=1 Tax=Paractinoplanes lichenicola TaxID=2802976 RepID=A0ABS1VV76_9ACTN|nr:MFS transporter [Actinoplanes lichenicola]MBL7258381.1 MFS transporter [Actinoplanes lichenicola]